MKLVRMDKYDFSERVVLKPYMGRNGWPSIELGASGN